MKIEVQIYKKKDIAQLVGEAVAEAMAQDEANAEVLIQLYLQKNTEQ